MGHDWATKNSFSNRTKVIVTFYQGHKYLRYTTIDNHLTYSANRSLSSCSELPLPRLATKSVEHGGLLRLAM